MIEARIFFVAHNDDGFEYVDKDSIPNAAEMLVQPSQYGAYGPRGIHLGG